MNLRPLYLFAIIFLMVVGFIPLAMAQDSFVIVSLSLAEWFGLPLTFETVLWWGLILALCLAGGTFGIMTKHYQAANWKFGQEDLVYYGMVIAASFYFLMVKTPPDQCFIFSAGLNGGLGIIRNMISKRTNGVVAEPTATPATQTAAGIQTGGKPPR